MCSYKFSVFILFMKGQHLSWHIPLYFPLWVSLPEECPNIDAPPAECPYKQVTPEDAPIYVFFQQSVLISVSSQHSVSPADCPLPGVPFPSQALPLLLEMEGGWGKYVSTLILGKQETWLKVFVNSKYTLQYVVLNAYKSNIKCIICKKKNQLYLPPVLAFSLFSSFFLSVNWPRSTQRLLCASMACLHPVPSWWEVARG